MPGVRQAVQEVFPTGRYSVTQPGNERPRQAGRDPVVPRHAGTHYLPERYLGVEQA